MVKHSSLVMRDIKHFKILLQALLAGIFSGLLVVAFKWSAESVFGYFQNSDIWNSVHKWWAVPLITTLGGLLSGILVFKFAPETSGSGIPFIKMVLVRVGAKVRLRSIWVKFLAGICALGSGMPLGREGPSVQLGAGAGMLVAKMFGVSGAHADKFVAAGSASALGAVFNAPIAGTIFVFEELLRKFSTHLLFPVLVATVIAASLARLFFGDYPSFLMPVITNYTVDGESLLCCLLLGIVAGGAGGAFSWLVLKFRAWFAAFTIVPNFARPALAGLLVGVLALWEPKILGAGNQLIESLLFNQLEVKIIVILLVVRFVLTPLCFGSGFAGGIFLPMLMIGAFLGYLCSMLAALMGVEVNAVVLALVGMAAFMAAVAQTPITAVVMVFEMSNGYHYILPIMLAAAVADLIASRLGHQPIYTLLQFNAMHNSLEAQKLAQISVGQCMQKSVLSVPQQMPILEALRLLQRKNLFLCPVVDACNKLKGVVSIKDIQDALIENNSSHVLVDDILNPSPIKVLPSSDLFSVYFRLHDEGESFALVVDEAKNVKGIVSNQDIYAYLEHKK